MTAPSPAAPSLRQALADFVRISEHWRNECHAAMPQEYYDALDAARAALAAEAAPAPMTRAERVKERLQHIICAGKPTLPEPPPYTEDEQEVCRYLDEIGVGKVAGFGDDPIRFLIASHATLAAERKGAPLADLPAAIRHHGREILASVEQAIRSAYLTGKSHGAMSAAPKASP